MFIYPNKDWPLLEVPFFIILTFILFVFTGTIAVFLHVYPEPTLNFLSVTITILKQPFDWFVKRWIDLVNININLFRSLLKWTEGTV